MLILDKKQQQEQEKRLSLSLKLERYLSKPIFKIILDIVTLIFFILVVIGPVVNIFMTIFLNPAILRCRKKKEQ